MSGAGFCPHQKCNKCGKPYPLTAAFWHRSTTNPTGFQYRCRGCKNRKGFAGKRRSRVSKGEARSLAEKYAEGKNSVQLAEEFSRSPTTVLRVVRQEEKAVRLQKDSVRRHKLNEHFFDFIDTEEKAYWLGFIAADGCVTKGNSVQIMLHARDGEHLTKLYRALGSTNKARYRPASNRPSSCPVASFGVRSEKLAAGLIKHGITKRKSLTMMPPNLPEGLMVPFWRGAFDGDGGLWFHGGRNAWAFSFVGSKAMVQGFEVFLKAHIPTRARVRPMGRIYRFGSTGNRVASALLQLLYGGAAVYLDRKYEVYRTVC